MARITRLSGKSVDANVDSFWKPERIVMNYLNKLTSSMIVQ